MGVSFGKLPRLCPCSNDPRPSEVALPSSEFVPPDKHMQERVSPPAVWDPLAQTLKTRDEEEEIVEREPDMSKCIPVATVILPGTEDPSKLMKRGGLELNWNSMKVRRFQERQMPHVVDENLALPPLYLHFIHNRFRPKDGEFNTALRAGNDNAELQLVLPQSFSEEIIQNADLGVGLRGALTRVLRFLMSQAEVQISRVEDMAGGFGPNTLKTASANCTRWYFGLTSARPKADVTLDKKSFGIPGDADLYLFAENHCSVAYMSAKDKDAFQTCIAELPNMQEPTLSEFAIFLKVFYEGGFAYNNREKLQGGYIPKNVGIAALGVVPAFEGQSAIATGYPYLLQARFLRFADTVPVTIPAITQMSPRHGRYGLCFARCVFVWEGDAFDSEGVLDFCSLTPHGGFYYVPQNLNAHQRLGGFVYAFGEAKSNLELPESIAATREPDVREHDRRVCVICLEGEAVMAIVPCGHRAYCTDCASATSAAAGGCPVCRGPINSTMRIF